MKALKMAFFGREWRKKGGRFLAERRQLKLRTREMLLNRSSWGVWLLEDCATRRRRNALSLDIRVRIAYTGLRHSMEPYA